MAKGTTATRSAADFLPEKVNLTSLRHAAAECHGCNLYKRATQTVFGEGPTRAKLFLLGEIPGDEEDRRGEPFVGPAGRLLEDALVDAGLERKDVYLTNVVKHFSWEPRGKRRLHKKPKQIEIVSCRAWLDAELLVVKPKVVVCLGATAAQAMLGKQFRVTQQRGKAVPLLPAEDDQIAIATWHPSAILRAPSDDDRTRMREELRDDLRKARKLAG